MLTAMVVQEGWSRGQMFRYRTTFRWLTAAYMAVLLPFCCCATAVHAADPVSPSPGVHAAHGHEHHGTASAGHHHEQLDLDSRQSPSGPDHPCGPGSDCHEGDCECGCSSGQAEFTLEATPATHLILASASMFVPIIDFAASRRPAVIQTPSPRDGRGTSLLRLHCALIV